jgi:hypothetical protein
MQRYGPQEPTYGNVLTRVYGPFKRLGQTLSPIQNPPMQVYSNRSGSRAAFMRTADGAIQELHSVRRPTRSSRGSDGLIVPPHRAATRAANWAGAAP